MVGRNSAEYPCFHILPHLLDSFLRLKNRSALIKRSFLNHIFVTERQIMSTGLRRNIISFVLRRFNLFSYRRVRHMTDMRFTSRRFGYLDNRIGSDDLRYNRAGLKKRFPVVAAGFFHPLFLILDDRIIFTMESRSPAEFLNDIHGLHCLPIV